MEYMLLLRVSRDTSHGEDSLKPLLSPFPFSLFMVRLGIYLVTFVLFCLCHTLRC